MKKLLSLLFFIFLSTGFLASQNDKIRVLIIDGDSYHDWSYTTEVIKSSLIHSGFCDIDISTAPAKDDPVELVYAQEDGWRSLFNGINLNGWSIACRKEDEGKNFWKADNGAIECNSIGKQDHNYVWLMTNEEFEDFQLRLNFQVFKESKGNSGVQFRSRYEPEVRNGGWLNGPQVDIHPPAPFRTGLIYDETDGVNRWIYPSMRNYEIAEKDVPKTALETVLVYAEDDQDAWNSMEIICKGMKIRTYINGLEISVFDGTGILDDSLHQQKNVGRKGKIALQLHASDELLIKYKNLFIRNY